MQLQSSIKWRAQKQCKDLLFMRQSVVLIKTSWQSFSVVQLKLAVLASKCTKYFYLKISIQMFLSTPSQCHATFTCQHFCKYWMHF